MSVSALQVTVQEQSSPKFTHVYISQRKNWFCFGIHPPGSGSRTLLKDSFISILLLHYVIGNFATISLMDKLNRSTWKFYQRWRPSLWQGHLRQILELTRVWITDLDSGHGTHLYFCFNCPIDLDDVLKIQHPVPLHYLWPWHKFRLAFNLWSLSCLFVCSLSTGHNSRTIFTKLQWQVCASPGGHGVKGQGHTATIIEISAIAFDLWSILLPA